MTVAANAFVPFHADRSRQRWGHMSPVAFLASRGGVVVGAGAVTLGLVALMASLIADEFVPQDVVEIAAFEINKLCSLAPRTVDRR